MLPVALLCWLCDLSTPFLYFVEFGKDKAALAADLGRGLQIHNTAADLAVLACLRAAVFFPYFLHIRGWLVRVLPCCACVGLSATPKHATRCAVLVQMLWGLANVSIVGLKVFLLTSSAQSFAAWRGGGGVADNTPLLWGMLVPGLLSSVLQLVVLRRLNRGKANGTEEEDILEHLLVKHLKRFLRQATSPVQLLLRLYAHEPGAIAEMDKVRPACSARSACWRALPLCWVSKCP